MTLSTHVLDTALGRPVEGMGVQVEHATDDGWVVVSRAVTGPGGRAADLVPAELWAPGLWRLVFDCGAHLGPDAFLPEVTLVFRTADDGHYHVPLLLAPFGYSTYRGS